MPNKRAESHRTELRAKSRFLAHCDGNDSLAETIPGTGNLDYRTYLAGLKRLSPDVPLMLEHLSTADEYRRA